VATISARRSRAATFPINVRYPRELRDSVEKIRVCRCSPSVAHRSGLGDVAAIVISDGPPMLKSENARLSGWVYVDLHGATSVPPCVNAAGGSARGQAARGLLPFLVGAIEFPRAGHRQAEDRGTGNAGIIFVLLYPRSAFRRSVPDHGYTAVRSRGRLWLMVSAGLQHVDRLRGRFIALGGVAAEIGVVMLIY